MTRIERRIGKEINRHKNKMKAHVVVKNVNVTMVQENRSKHQYSLIVPRNTFFSSFSTKLQNNFIFQI